MCEGCERELRVRTETTGSLLSDEESLPTLTQKTALCVLAATAKAQRRAAQTLIYVWTHKPKTESVL